MAGYVRFLIKRYHRSAKNAVLNCGDLGKNKQFNKGTGGNFDYSIMKRAINEGDNEKKKEKGLPPSHHPSRASLYPNLDNCWISLT